MAPRGKQALPPTFLLSLFGGKWGKNVDNPSESGDFAGQSTDPAAPNYVAPLAFTDTTFATRQMSYSGVRFLIPANMVLAEQTTYELLRQYYRVLGGVVVLMHLPGPSTGMTSSLFAARYLMNFFSGKSKAYLFRMDTIQVHPADLGLFNAVGADYAIAKFNGLVLGFQLGPALARDGCAGIQVYAPGD